MKKLLPFGPLVAIACLSPGLRAKDELPPKYSGSVCVIEGAEGKGTGFIATFKGRPVIVTNQHVVLGNTNLKITNSEGLQLKPSGGAVASGSDVAMLFLAAPLPQGVVPFELSPAATKTAKVGDAVLISGNALGDGTITTTPGMVKSLGPDRIEHDAPTFSGNSGSPVFHVQSGLVIGIDTETTDSFPKMTRADKSSAKKAEAAVSGDGMRLFAHRFDTEKEWLPLDWKASATIEAEMLKVQQLLQDSVGVIKGGKCTEIKDDVMRDQFTRVEEMQGKANVSDADFYNSFIKAVESTRNSLDFKIRGLKKDGKGFYRSKQVTTLSENAARVCEALDVLKGDIKLAKSLYAGKYVMPAKVKALLYPDGTLLIYD